MKLKDVINQNRELVQLAYGIILMVLIPLLIVLNTVFIIQKYNESLDVTLQRQALNLGRSVQIFLEQELRDSSRLQQSIEQLAGNNTELLDAMVLVPEDETFKILAAQERQSVGRKLDYYYFQLAWQQPDGNGLVTDSLALARTDEGGFYEQSIDPGARYWLIAMPMKGESGDKEALLVMKISSQIVDEMTEYNRNASVYFLVFTVLVVVLFLLAVVRIWDYVLLYRKIKEVDAMKDEFISVASHELQAPVTSIRGYTSMILDGTFGELSDDIRTSAERIQQSADRLAVLVSDLLNVSRIEQKRLKVEFEEIDPDKAARETVEEFRHQAEDKGLALAFHPQNGRNIRIQVDPQRFHQVLANLIGNAVKYTKKGKVDVFSQIKDGRYIIKIKDTGVGMGANERERLFTKFYRARNEKTRDISGTGLGLWITKQLVELMNGTIAVDSMEDVGSQFTITFSLIKK
jgi:signal transduction histidine kinase